MAKKKSLTEFSTMYEDSEAKSIWTYDLAVGTGKAGLISVEYIYNFNWWIRRDSNSRPDDQTKKLIHRLSHVFLNRQNKEFVGLLKLINCRLFHKAQTTKAHCLCPSVPRIDTPR